MNNHLDRVAQAFSHKALVYDAFGEDHINLARMRRQVYDHVLRYLQPGDRLLELNAGTGADAVFFVGQGFRVHATDISPGMIASIQDKIAHYGLHERLTVQRCSFTELEQVTCGPFQHVYSNLGGLNCVGDLRLVSHQLPHLLAPGGRLTWVIMPPICPWDLALIFKGQFKQATRRLARGGTLAHVEGVHFVVHYFTPRQVMQALSQDFHLLQLEGLSVLTPPADRKNFARRFPRLYRLLAALDDRVRHIPPFNQCGDFYLLTAQYLPQRIER